MPDDGGMYIVTNREVSSSKRGFNKFGKEPSAKGPLELRLVKVRKQGRSWDIQIMPDTVKRRVGGESVEVPYSKIAARTIFDRLTASPPTGPRRKDLLFYVHGFNNDIESVVKRAWALQQAFGLEVVPFSWPANGGGATGVVSYKSDKRDVLASVGALDRTLEKLRAYLEEFRGERLAALREQAEKKSRDSRMASDELFARLGQRDCPFRINLMLHSMGNYLFKHLMGSSTYGGKQLTFDNVVLASADTNNKDHRAWVDRITVRNRVYVTINESDSALRVSRMKGGDEQLARLGHYPYNLESRQTVYVDFSDARSVGSSHAYFEGGSLKNAKVNRFFKQAFHGEVAEERLEYDAARNLYSV